MPDFVAPIYALAPEPLPANPERIPMFLACAADDPLVPPAENSVKVYDLWHGAGIPTELHVFPKGGHGFGIRKQNLPSDEWTEMFQRLSLIHIFLVGILALLLVVASFYADYKWRQWIVARRRDRH